MFYRTPQHTLVTRVLLMGLVHVTCVSGCCEQSARQLLDFTNPERDANSDISSNRISFVVVDGFARYVPGVYGTDGQYVDKYGTHEAIVANDSDRSDQLAAADLYGERYNVVILSYLKNRSKPDSNRPQAQNSRKRPANDYTPRSATSLILPDRERKTGRTGLNNHK